jgi:hypothetical protein
MLGDAIGLLIEGWATESKNRFDAHAVRSVLLG